MELSPAEKKYFPDLYKLADLDKDKVVGGTEAPLFLRKAKLDDITLGKVIV